MERITAINNLPIPTTNGGGGDMYKVNYDSDGDGIVNGSETIVHTVQLGENVSYGDCLYVHYSPGPSPANNLAFISLNVNPLLTNPCKFIALSGGSTGDKIKVVSFGVFSRNNTSHLDTLYLNPLTGKITSTKPTSGVIQIVGRALDQTLSLIDIENTSLRNDLSSVDTSSLKFDISFNTALSNGKTLGRYTGDDQSVSYTQKTLQYILEDLGTEALAPSYNGPSFSYTWNLGNDDTNYEIGSTIGYNWSLNTSNKGSTSPIYPPRIVSELVTVDLSNIIYSGSIANGITTIPSGSGSHTVAQGMNNLNIAVNYVGNGPTYMSTSTVLNPVQHIASIAAATFSQNRYIRGRYKMFYGAGVDNMDEATAITLPTVWDNQNFPNYGAGTTYKSFYFFVPPTRTANTISLTTSNNELIVFTKDIDVTLLIQGVNVTYKRFHIQNDIPYPTAGLNFNSITIT